MTWSIPLPWLQIDASATQLRVSEARQPLHAKCIQSGQSFLANLAMAEIWARVQEEGGTL